MPYVEGRVVHDCDSHIMELPGWLDEFLDPAIRDRVEAIPGRPFKVGKYSAEDIERQHDDPDHQAKLEENVMATRGWFALGAYRKEDRIRALDLMGFASQVVLTTAGLGALARVEHRDDRDLAYGLARAHNRAMADFCSADDRLLPVYYLPLVDMAQSADFVGEAIDTGAAALMVDAACPEGHGHSHVDLDRVWAQAAEARVPIVLHVGAVGARLMDPTYTENGLPKVKDFTGGDGNFTSVSFMSIPYIPAQTLSVFILDGVLDRFPDLRIGLLELGCSWIPGWMRFLDSAADAFGRNEERLRKLSLKPSEYVQRQIRVGPYPHEDVGWVMQNGGDQVLMFSSDYPHIEGGRNPVKRFETSLETCSDAQKQAFYCDNYVDFIGSSLDRVPVPAAG